MKLDVLAIGPHPDDADLGVGGMLHKWAARGLQVGILDLTRGEMSSRGTLEERAREAEEAARRLGVAVRRNASLPDGGVRNTPEQQQTLVRFFRELRPQVLLAPHAPDRHPDHAAAQALVHDANFVAGLTKVDTGQPPWRAQSVCYYHPYEDLEQAPQVVIDISDHLDAKLEALRAYASQLHNPAYAAPATYVASEAFWNNIEVRAAYWGSRVGVRYGEPLFAAMPLKLELPPGFEHNQPPDEVSQ